MAVASPTAVPEQPTGTSSGQDQATPSFPTDSGKTQTFSDDKLGFSFNYPTAWTLLQRAPDAPPGVTLRGPSVGQGTEPIIFAITIDVQPSNGDSVKTIVDQQLSQVPKDLQGGISREPVVVGGAPGEEVIGLPSQSGAIESFITNGDQVFVVILQPYDPGNAVLLPYLSGARTAYNTILNSWQWLK